MPPQLPHGFGTVTHEQSGASRKLLGGVMAALANTPLIGERIGDGEFRRLPLAPFPYLVVYTISGDTVLVVRIPHVRRAPAQWSQSR